MSTSVLSVVANTVPAAGPFKQRPGRHVREEFFAWVRETGRPDTWRFHDHSRPPADQDFVELDHFVIPDIKRADVGMATCPVCSPNAPKYYSGVLAWFQAEGVLRAIGHECAKQHFGIERANAAIAARKLHDAVEGAQDYLLETLPKIYGLRTEVDALQQPAIDADRIRELIWAASSRTASEKLAKMGSTGALAVERVREIDAVDAYGKNIKTYQSEIVATYAVSGLNFISRRFNSTGLARQTADLLQRVQAGTEEEALEFICNQLKANDHLFQAEALTRVALEQVENLRLAVRQSKQFLAPDNLASLADYTRQNRLGAPVQFDFSHQFAARMRVKGANKKWREIGIPGTLR